jgi:RND family efflux transporter MFP subunit
MKDDTEQSKKSFVPLRRIPLRAKVWTSYGALTVLALAVLAGLHFSHSSDANAATAAPVPTVGVSVPMQRSVEPRLEFLGQLSAVEDVQLRAQVGGTLTMINFKDGGIVHKGDVLFEVDRTPYQIKFSQASAGLESAQARLALAARQLNRAQQLKSSDAGTQESVDQAVAEKLAAQAAVDGAQSQVRDAKFDLDRCEVTAPFTGRIGTHLVSVGSLVSGNRAGEGPTTLLASMVSVDPIYANFDMSESDYMIFLHQREEDHGPLSDKVTIALTGERKFDRSGTMTFIDNAIDRSSGTIHARATIANSDLMLTPGAFARVRLALAHPAPVLLVPDAVVLADQNEHIVLTLGPGDVVTPKKVQVGDLRGGLRVIRSGLTSSDKVIIDGIPTIAPGEKVSSQAATIRFDSTQDQG